MQFEEIKSKIVVALDVKTLDEAKYLVDELKDYTGTFKVGLQLYCAFGNEIVDYIKKQNANFFLDVKLMDIPNTVAGAARSLVSRGASFFNVHTLGGLEMMKAAKQAADEITSDATVLGVTVLTSISDEILQNEIKVSETASNYALYLAGLAHQAGLTGVVASAHEARKIKEKYGADFKVLCPGIRPASTSVDDQKRVATPKFAISEGADWIVLGRAITKSENPKESIKKVFEELK